MSSKVITINMAEMAVGARGTLISTMSLGSCVAIVLHDHENMIGGMAHAMLPSRKSAPTDVVEEARKNIKSNEAVAKYADESVVRLFDEIIKMGAKKENIKAKLVGGAKMFKFLSGDDHGVGFRNAESARAQLLLLGIPIESEEIGGSSGRSAEFNIENGLVQITTVI